MINDNNDKDIDNANDNASNWLPPLLSAMKNVLSRIV